jgi:hypothetical protein
MPDPITPQPKIQSNLCQNVIVNTPAARVQSLKWLPYRLYLANLALSVLASNLSPAVGGCHTVALL